MASEKYAGMHPALARLFKAGDSVLPDGDDGSGCGEVEGSDGLAAMDVLKHLLDTYFHQAHLP